jgi:hypothetical protein
MVRQGHDMLNLLVLERKASRAMVGREQGELAADFIALGTYHDT